MKYKNFQHPVERRVYKDYNENQKVIGLLFYSVQIGKNKEFFTGHSEAYYTKILDIDSLDSFAKEYKDGDYIILKLPDKNNTLVTLEYRVTVDSKNFCQKLKIQETILKEGFKIGLN